MDVNDFGTFAMYVVIAIIILAAVILITEIYRKIRNKE